MNDLIIINGKSFPTLVAITEDEQHRGLMYREWPPPIMSFPFITADKRKFWMKNTPSPLDIIFCNSGKIIEIYKGEPNSEKFLGPNSLVDLVVEMPAGLSQKHFIAAGNLVQLRYSVPTLAKHYELKLAMKSST